MNSLEELSAKLAKKVSPDGWLCGPNAVEEYTRLLVAALGAQETVARVIYTEPDLPPALEKLSGIDALPVGMHDLFTAPVLPVAQEPVGEYWLPMHINGQIDFGSDPITSEDDCDNCPLIDGWKWTKLYLHSAPVLPVAQEPVAEVCQDDINQITWLAPSMGVGRGSKLFAAPVLPVAQEPVAEVCQDDINQITWLAPSMGVGRGSKLFAAPVLPSAPECEWTSDSDGSYYTGCGQYFTLNEGTPADNGMLFCLHCGGRLKISDHDAEEVMTGCAPSPQEEK